MITKITRAPSDHPDYTQIRRTVSCPRRYDSCSSLAVLRLRCLSPWPTFLFVLLPLGCGASPSSSPAAGGSAGTAGAAMSGATGGAASSGGAGATLVGAGGAGGAGGHAGTTSAGGEHGGGSGLGGEGGSSGQSSGGAAGASGMAGKSGDAGTGGMAGAAGSSVTPALSLCDADPGSMVAPTSPPVDDPSPPCAKTIDVTSTATLAAALTGVTPGTCIEVADGSYAMSNVTAQGTAAAPIVLRAKHRGKAIVASGTLTLDASSYFVFEGFDWSGPGTVQVKSCDHCRLTRNRFHLAETADIDWIVIRVATDTRIDHNDIGPKQFTGNPISVFGDNVTTSAKRTRIDHNYLHDIGPFTGGNPGGEAIRAGVGSLGADNAHTVIEHNLFQACDGDPETISVKTSEAVVRYNTLRASAGFISLRIGDRSRACGNFVLGESKAGSGGVRLCGDDHVVFDNYVQGVASVALELHEGSADHAQVHRAVVVHNTFLSDATGLELGGGEPPTDCHLSNNVFESKNAHAIVQAAVPPGLVAGANFTAPWQAGYPTGFVDVAAGLVLQGEMYRAVPTSKVVDAGVAGFSWVAVDMDGQARDAMPDVGADELSSATVVRRPLTEADVGPDAVE